MPGSLRIKILSARNLPVMDRASDLTDAFVEIRIGNENFKTDVCKKSLNPFWNTDWITFQLDDQQLQEETLQIRVLDHDTYSSHDSIGKVFVNLETLLIRKKNRIMIGWFPIYDTIHGIRGELNLSLRLDRFSDFSKYRQSSIGVRFFYSKCLPEGFKITKLLGFVEKLILMDDPEHEWREKLRTARASNETRQRLFSKLIGELQRKIGVKVLEMLGNSVIGFRINFDLEGETGVVIRGIGTVVELEEINIPDSASLPKSPMDTSNAFDCRETQSQEALTEINNNNNNSSYINSDHSIITNCSNTSSTTNNNMTATANNKSIAVVNNNHNVTSSNVAPATSIINSSSISPIVRQTNQDLGEFPLLTIIKPPVGFIESFGSFVSVKSVKILEKSHCEEQETRDAWWLELRSEISAHMRSIKCNAVFGYSESCYIYEDVCILSGSGTAVKLDTKYLGNHVISEPTDGVNSTDKNKKFHLNFESNKRFNVTSVDENISLRSCRLCHVPSIGLDSVSITSVAMSPCQVCGMQSSVPEIIFSTSDIPDEMGVIGNTALIQARVCRAKRETKGESCAKEINELLPFLEYDLHYKLVHNVIMKGLNAIFGLKIRICVSDDLLVGIGTGTGVFLSALRQPTLPNPSHFTKEEDRLLTDVVKFQMKCSSFLNIYTNEHRSTKYQIPLDNLDRQHDLNTHTKPTIKAKSIKSPSSSSAANNKVFSRSISDNGKRNVSDKTFLDTGLLDLNFIGSVIREGLPPPGVTMETINFSKSLASADRSRMLVRFTRSLALIGQSEDYSSSSGQSMNLTNLANERLDNLMQQFHASLWLKLRCFMPYVVSQCDYQFAITEDNNIEILFSGFVSSCISASFKTEEKEQEMKLTSKISTVSMLSTATTTSIAIPQATTFNISTSNVIAMPTNTKQQSFFLITPLSSVNGFSIESYLGSVNFFFIRETTSLREYKGIDGFIQSCINEAEILVSAQTMAAGGNCLLSVSISDSLLNSGGGGVSGVGNAVGRQINSAQILVNICGDMARGSYISIPLTD